MIDVKTKVSPKSEGASDLPIEISDVHKFFDDDDDVGVVLDKKQFATKLEISCFSTKLFSSSSSSNERTENQNCPSRAGSTERRFNLPPEASAEFGHPLRDHAAGQSKMAFVM